MSSTPFIMGVLVASSLLCFLTNSWITLWVLLEMNTLSFCSLMKTEKYKTMLEMSMKYFIVQSISSALLIMSSIFTKVLFSFVSLFFFISAISLFVKSAASPFHQWFVFVVKKSNWFSGTILMTWQKFASVFLMVYQIKNIVFLFLVPSFILGAILQYNKSNSKEIMSYSSIFNLGWMMLAIVFSTKTFVYFSLLYWPSVIIVNFLFKTSKLSKINENSVSQMKSWVYILVLANLAGLPPFMGFVAKVATFLNSIQNLTIFFSVLVLTTSSINLFIYLRLINNISTKISFFKQKSFLMLNKYTMLLLFSVLIFPIIFIPFLGNAWSKDYFDSMENLNPMRKTYTTKKYRALHYYVDFL